MSTPLSHAKEVESDVIHSARGVGSNTITIATALDGPRSSSSASPSTTGSEVAAVDEVAVVPDEERGEDDEEPNQHHAELREEVEGSTTALTHNSIVADTVDEPTYAEELVSPNPLSKSTNSKGVESDVIQTAREVGMKTVIIAYATMATSDNRSIDETKAGDDDVEAAAHNTDVADEEVVASSKQETVIADEEAEELTPAEEERTRAADDQPTSVNNEPTDVVDDEDEAKDDHVGDEEHPAVSDDEPVVEEGIEEPSSPVEETAVSAQEEQTAMTEESYVDKLVSPKSVSKSTNPKGVESDVIQTAREVGRKTVIIAYAFEESPPTTMATSDNRSIDETKADVDEPRAVLVDEEMEEPTVADEEPAANDDTVEEPTTTAADVAEDKVEEPAAADDETEEPVTEAKESADNHLASGADDEPAAANYDTEEPTAADEEPITVGEVATHADRSNYSDEAAEPAATDNSRGMPVEEVSVADEEAEEPTAAVADEEAEEPAAEEVSVANEEAEEPADAVADEEAEEPAANGEAEEPAAAVADEEVEEPAAEEVSVANEEAEEPAAEEPAANEEAEEPAAAVDDEEAEEPADAVADEEAEEPAAAVDDEEAEEPAANEEAEEAAVADHHDGNAEDEQDNNGSDPTPEVPTAQPPASPSQTSRDGDGTPLSHHSSEADAEADVQQEEAHNQSVSRRTDSTTTGPSESPSGVVYKRHYPKGTYPRHTHSVPFTSARRQMHANDRSVDPITGKHRREPSPFFVHAVPHRPPAKGSPTRHQQQQPSSSRTNNSNDDASTAARKATENGSDHHRPSLTATSPRDAAAAAEKRKRKNNVFLLNVPSTQRAAVIIQHEAHRQTVENIVTNKIPRPPLIGTNISARDYALSTKVGGSSSHKKASSTTTTSPRGTTTTEDPNLESPTSPRRRKAACDDRNPLSATGKYGVVTMHGRAVETIMTEDRRVQPRYFNKEDVIRGLPPNKRRQPRAEATTTTTTDDSAAVPQQAIEDSKAPNHSRSGSTHSVSSVSSVSSSISSSSSDASQKGSDAEGGSEDSEKRAKREKKEEKMAKKENKEKSRAAKKDATASKNTAPATSQALVPTKPAPKGAQNQQAFVSKIPALPVIRSSYASPRHNDTRKAMSKENIRLGRNIVMVKSTVPTAHQCRLVTIQKQEWAHQFRKPNYLLQPPPTVGRSKSKKTKESKQVLAIEGPPATTNPNEDATAPNGGDVSDRQRSTSAASSSSSSSSSSSDVLPPIAPSSAPAAPRSSAAVQQQNRNSSASVKLPRVFVRGAPSSTQGPTSGGGGLVAMPTPTVTQTVSPRNRPVQPREGGPGGGRGIIVVSAATGGLVPASRTEYNAVREHGWNCDATVVRTRRADLRLKLGGLVEEVQKPAHSVSPLVARSAQPAKNREEDEGPSGGGMIMDFEDEPEPATKGKEAVAQYKAWKVRENDRIKTRTQEIERIKNEKHVQRLQRKLHPVPPTKRATKEDGEVHEAQTGAPQPASVGGGVRMHSKANFNSCRKGNPCNKPQPEPSPVTTELLVSEPTLAAGEAHPEDGQATTSQEEEQHPSTKGTPQSDVSGEAREGAEGQRGTTHYVVTEEYYVEEGSPQDDENQGALAPPSRTPSRRSSRSQSADSRSNRSPSSHRSSSSVSRRTSAAASRRSSAVASHRSSAASSRRSSAVPSRHSSPAASRRSSSASQMHEEREEGGDKAESDNQNHQADEEEEYGDEDFEEPVEEEEL